MWNPRLKAAARGVTKQGWVYSFTPSFLKWRAPKGVRTPSRHEINRAMASIPAEIDWEWARSRLIPVLERPGGGGTRRDPHLAGLAASGVRYGYAAEQGPMLLRVAESTAEHWERSPEEIEAAALDNFRRHIAKLTPADVIHESGGSTNLSAITKPQGWPTSLLLLPDELCRLFGTDDQVFTAPSRALLLAFPIGTPTDTVEFFTDHFAELDPHPLQLEPFVLEHGSLRFEGAVH